METQEQPVQIEQKPYQPPQITVELELETRAGSPLINPFELPDSFRLK
jgi:hypothetical protein